MSGEDDPPGVVFDCVVFLQAAANENGPSGSAFDLLDRGEIKLFVSEQILLEIRSSLNHPRVRQKLRGITDERVEAIFKRLDKLAIPIKRSTASFRVSARPEGRALCQSGNCCRSRVSRQPRQRPFGFDEGRNQRSRGFP